MDVKMPLVNVGPQVSAEVCKGGESGPMRTAMRNWGSVVSKVALFRTFFMDEPLSRNLSRNLSRKNAQP